MYVLNDVPVIGEEKKVYRRRSQAIGLGLVLLVDVVLGTEGAVRAGGATHAR